MTPLLLLLSRFSRVRLCATPETAAHQAPPSLGFSSKNTGVGCHFLLQCMKVKSESEDTQLCPTLSDPVDCSLPGSPVHGIFQARVLEWGAIAFSACGLYYSLNIYSPKHLYMSLSISLYTSILNCFLVFLCYIPYFTITYMLLSKYQIQHCQSFTFSHLCKLYS